METQYDYETEPMLAIFWSREQASEAIRQLQAHGIDAHAISQTSLQPGRYQAEDRSLHEEHDGMLRGAFVGAPIGAGVGAGLAAAIPGAGPAAMVGLAAGGGACGTILGGFVGAIARAHFDDDVARWIDVPDAGAELVVVCNGGALGREEARARKVLERAGTVGFLDATTPFAERALRACGLARLV